MEVTSYFTVLDYIVLFGTMGVSLFIGIFFACRSRNNESIENYFHGNRKVSFIPTALSLVVTFQSSLLIIGVPAEVYAYGFRYAYYIIGVSMSFLFAGIVVVPVFHPLKLTSVYKYFVFRYHDNTIRYLMMALGIAYYILYMGTVTFGTCVALEVIMGIPHWGTIVIFTCITSIYTSIGGVKAVIWTDVFQVSVMVMGVIAIIVKSTLEVGGLANVLEAGSSRLQMNAFTIDPTVRFQFWNLTIGSFTAFLVNCCQQPGIQRINTSPTVSSARRIFTLSAIVYVPIAFLVCFEGVAIYAYYNYKGCDPIASGRINDYDQISPLAVVDLFAGSPGLAGLFLAALSSAALSTISSSLNSLGAVTYDDVIREKYPNMSDTKATNICKGIVFMYGLVGMAITFIIAALPGSIINVFFVIVSSIDGPTCAICLVSIFYRRATTKGVMTGAFTGMAITIWLSLGNMLATTKVTPTLPPASTAFCPQNATDIWTNETYFRYGVNSTLSSALPTMEHTTVTPMPEYSILQLIYSISFMFYSSIGCVIAIVVSIIVSKLTTPPEHIDERCFFSFQQHVWKPLFGKNPDGKASLKADALANNSECKGYETTELLRKRTDV